MLITVKIPFHHQIHDLGHEAVFYQDELGIFLRNGAYKLNDPLIPEIMLCIANEARINPMILLITVMTYSPIRSCILLAISNNKQVRLITNNTLSVVNACC